MSVLKGDRKEKTGNTAKGHMMMEVAFRVTQLQNQEMLRTAGSNRMQERGVEPPEEPTLQTPWLQTSSLQKRERERETVLFKPPNVR